MQEHDATARTGATARAIRSRPRVLLVETAAVCGAPVHVVDGVLDLRIVDHGHVAVAPPLQRVEEGLGVSGDVLRRVVGHLLDDV